MNYQVSIREYSNGKETITVSFHFWTGSRRATSIFFAFGNKEYSYQRPTAAEKKLETLGFHYVRTKSAKSIY